tara:strand:+ start:2583 stop:3644 length:1062 start_codon:yes stop_codon:yes gene_type:complete
MEIVRIGIIGAGWVTQERHLPRLQKVREATVDRIWSWHPENARKVADTFGIPSTPRNWREIVDDESIDAIIVSAPPILHAEASIAALQAGKHVLCQGRMARNLSEAYQMRAAWKSTEKVAALYPPFPGLKGDRVVRRLLKEENFVGEVREVRVSGLTFTPPADGYTWLADPDVVGINTMTLGLWCEVLNRWVGPATRVTAIGRSHTSKRFDLDGQSVDAVVPDSLAIAANLECGASTSYHFSTCAAAAPEQSIEIYGTKGALIYQMHSGVLRGAGAGEAIEPIEISPDEERDQTTDSEFVLAILTGSPVSPDFEDGVRYMEFSEAVAISIHEGRTVSLPLTQGVMQTWGQKIQ